MIAKFIQLNPILLIFNMIAKMKMRQFCLEIIAKISVPLKQLGVKHYGESSLNIIYISS